MNKNIMNKNILKLLLLSLVFMLFAAGCSKESQTEKKQVTVFAAASLSKVMDELIREYGIDNEDVEIIVNADSSGTLLAQIEEGGSCDIFFSAAQNQMDQLQTDGFIYDGKRQNVVNNQVVLIKRKDTDVGVRGLSDIDKAESIALADGSVPVGKYTRTAMMKLGILPESNQPEKYSTNEVSEALGGVEISEQGNVSKVLLAVKEGSCQVGTTYYSDIYGSEDEIEIIECVSNELSGDVIYPVARIVNNDANDAQNNAADEFYEYICSDRAKDIFEKYYFDTNVNK